MSNYLIAVDGGGTKTEYLLSDVDSNVTSSLNHAQIGLTTSNLGIAAFNLREGVRRLLENLPPGEISVLTLALAGLDTPTERLKAERVFTETLNIWKIKRLVLINDAVAALMNGQQNQDAAIVLIAGTGSNCLGYNAAGSYAKASGLDFILSDEGSGYDAGRLALKAAVRSYDGRGPKSSLEQTIFTKYHLQHASNLKEIVYNPLINKSELASLAKPCVEAYRAGDPAARQIIDHCLQQLLLNVTTVAKKLELSADQPFELVLTGSFLLALSADFTAKLHTVLPQAQISIPESPPVYGALKIAQKIHHGAPPEQYDVTTL